VRELPRPFVLLRRYDSLGESGGPRNSTPQGLPKTFSASRPGFSFEELAELGKEAGGIHRRQDHDELTRGLIGDVDEGVRIAARHADYVACSGLETATIDLEEITALENTEDFRLMMTVHRRPEAGSIYRFDDGESSV
jgi:hypothetical protein